MPYKTLPVTNDHAQFVIESIKFLHHTKDRYMKAVFIPLLLISSVLSTSVFAADSPQAANSEASTLARKNYPDLPPPAGPYSIAVRHGKTLYLSGMTAFGSEAQGKGMLEQAEAIFDQMERVTQAEGIGMENLIKVTIFVTSMDDVAALRQMLAQQYGGANPASSLVRVVELAAPGLNIEIEAVFALS